MIQIHVGNSYSRVIGLNVEQFSALRKELSYTSGSYFSGFGVTRKSLLSKRGDFPTGLLPRVRTLFSKLAVGYHVKSTPVNTNRVSLKWVINKKPYTWQLKAASNTIKLNGTISAPTGSGKSLAIALTIAAHRLRTLIVVPNIEIRKQLMNDLRAIFGKTPYITVLNIDSPKLKAKEKYDLLIIDEVHHAAAKTYHRLNKTAWSKISRRVCFTATPFRNNKEETLLYEAIAGPVIYELTYKRAVKEGFIVPVEAYYYNLPNTQSEAYAYSSVYKELIVNNDIRNELIVDLAIKLKEANISTLILVKEISHGEKLSVMADLDFVNGQEDSSRFYLKEFNEGKIPVLIATEGICGEGVDTKPCEYIILASTGKAKSSFMQKVGRGVRRYKNKESCKVILFRDTSHKWLIKHFNEQRRILIDYYGIKPVELKF